MNMSMNTQRLTISMPDYLYDQLTAMFSRGRISRFVSEAVEKLLVTRRIEKKVDPVDELLRIKKGLPNISSKQILEAIHRGRE